MSGALVRLLGQARGEAPALVPVPIPMMSHLRGGAEQSYASAEMIEENEGPATAHARSQAARAAVPSADTRPTALSGEKPTNPHIPRKSGFLPDSSVAEALSGDRRTRATLSASSASERGSNESSDGNSNEQNGSVFRAGRDTPLDRPSAPGTSRSRKGQETGSTETSVTDPAASPSSDPKAHGRTRDGPLSRNIPVGFPGEVSDEPASSGLRGGEDIALRSAPEHATVRVETSPADTIERIEAPASARPSGRASIGRPAIDTPGGQQVYADAIPRHDQRTRAVPAHAARTAMAERPAAQPMSPTDVHVTIGRVEVQAAPARVEPARVRSPQQPQLSLADYLRRRSGRTP
jgi:hypothetical protein